MLFLGDFLGIQLLDLCEFAFGVVLLFLELTLPLLVELLDLGCFLLLTEADDFLDVLLLHRFEVLGFLEIL